jgi:hypothetical protein
MKKMLTTSGFAFAISTLLTILTRKNSRNRIISATAMVLSLLVITVQAIPTMLLFDSTLTGVVLFTIGLLVNIVTSIYLIICILGALASGTWEDSISEDLKTLGIASINILIEAYALEAFINAFLILFGQF